MRRNVGLGTLMESGGRAKAPKADQTLARLQLCRGLQTNHGVVKSIALVSTCVAADSFTSLWLKR